MSTLWPYLLPAAAVVGGILGMALSKFLRREAVVIGQTHPVWGAAAASLAEAIDQHASRDEIVDAATKSAAAKGTIQGVSVTEALNTVLANVK
jgi:uncharacterized oligopeptide transporter (OPT) family protein